MKHYVFSRLLQLIPILFVITFLSFAMMRLAGSDVVLQSMERTGMAASDAVVAAARAELGLDKPFLTQYYTWLGKILQGDMGRSYVSGRPVLRPSLQNFPQRFCLPECLSVSRFSYHCRSEFFRRSIKTAGATG